MGRNRLLVVQCAGLGYEFLAGTRPASGSVPAGGSNGMTGQSLRSAGLDFRPIETVFPAVTCTVQASFRTASTPSAHGVVGNGWLDREFRKVSFWEQSSALVAGERIWSNFRSRGRRVAILFWQQSLGEDADLILSPAPIHKHHGGMIEDCYSKPDGLYARLCEKVGGPFKLRHYWGPMASTKGGDWIAEATAALLGDSELAPDLCLTYLPTLDYDLQRHGPADKRSADAMDALAAQLHRLTHAAEDSGYDVLVFGDYAISEVLDARFPNRELLDKGFMKVRTVGGMLYPDFHESRAFAVVDHQVAHVYVKSPTDIERLRRLLGGIGGGNVAVLDRSAQKDYGINHARAGDLVLIADVESWFAYPWWTSKREAPDYATHVDIHQKPGYDPCELFFGFPPIKTSTDATRIRGSHGRPGVPATWASTLDLGDPQNLIALAEAVRLRLDSC